MCGHVFLGALGQAWKEEWVTIENQQGNRELVVSGSWDFVQKLQGTWSQWSSSAFPAFSSKIKCKTDLFYSSHILFLFPHKGTEWWCLWRASCVCSPGVWSLECELELWGLCASEYWKTWQEKKKKKGAWEGSKILHFLVFYRSPSQCFHLALFCDFSNKTQPTRVCLDDIGTTWWGGKG